MPTYHRATPTEASAEQLYDWHARPAAFHRLIPPWEDTRVITHAGITLGGRTEMSQPIVGPIRNRWLAEITWDERPIGFDDTQIDGPFAQWVHHHRFEDGVIDDRIEWQPPLGGLGVAVAGGMLESRIDRGFRHRHQVTVQDLSRLLAGPQGLRVAITGASGLVGTALTHFLEAGGHTVIPLVRRKEELVGDAVYWNVREGEIDAAGLEGLDAVVHLAGAGIADEPWTDERKQLIRDSRVDGTALLCRALAGLKDKPPVLISGSAVGIYGDRSEPVDETSPPGTGFLADVGQQWEAAALPAQQAGIRTVFLRTGLVLSTKGGLLPPLLPMFRAGGGGPIAGGDQFQPWIHLDDLVYAIHFAITRDQVDGPINGTAPEPVPQRTFAKALGRAVSRPAFIPAPAAAVRMAMGREQADELVLAGQNAVPRALDDAGFVWAHPDLEPALRSLLGT